MKHLIIDNQTNVNNDNTITTDKIGEVYNARLVNPPFFKQISIILQNLTKYDLERISNMCLVNGKIYFIKQYEYFFKNNKKINNELFLFIKPNNEIYTFPNKRSVDFIIIGTQRAGTTSLSQNLIKHKDIFMNSNPDPKISEIHYFDLNIKKGFDWYKKQFDYKYKLVGEKTPELLNLNHTFPLIQAINPYVKLIIILRNPIIRAYSSWKHMQKYFDEKRTFEQAIIDEMNNIENNHNTNNTFHTLLHKYLQRGKYYSHIKKLLKWFPRQNILILLSEDQINPKKEYKKIYDFLNIDFIEQKYEIFHSSDNKETMNDKLYNSLKDFYIKDVEKLEKKLNIKTNWF